MVQFKETGEYRKQTMQAWASLDHVIALVGRVFAEHVDIISFALHCRCLASLSSVDASLWLLSGWWTHTSPPSASVLSLMCCSLMFSSWYSALSVAWSLEVEQCRTANLTTCYSMPKNTLPEMGWLVLRLADSFVVGSLNGNPFLKEYSGLSHCFCLRKIQNLEDTVRLAMKVNGANLWTLKYSLFQ